MSKLLQKEGNTGRFDRPHLKVIPEKRTQGKRATATNVGKWDGERGKQAAADNAEGLQKYKQSGKKEDLDGYI